MEPATIVQFFQGLPRLPTGAVAMRERQSREPRARFTSNGDEGWAPQDHGLR
jgi:hypothetical protein